MSERDPIRTSSGPSHSIIRGLSAAILTHDDVLALGLRQRAAEAEATPQGGPRIGRGVIQRARIKPGINCVVRGYRRGGLIGRALSHRFLRPVSGVWHARPFKEFEVLERLHQHGARVPQPIAALVVTQAFGLWYEGWIVTLEIPQSRTMLEVLLENADSQRAEQLAYACGVEARRCLELGVLHVDLHLGNILLTTENDYFLIDFDRAVTGSNRSRGIAFLRSRWSRGVEKHFSSNRQLAAALVQGFTGGLDATS